MTAPREPRGGEPAGGGTSTLPRRLPGIDVLRGIAAGAVAIEHVVQTTFSAAYHGARWTGAGAWGVGLFFVISGFCIHAPMVRQELGGGGSTLDLGAFYRRRFFRLYPAHVIALFLSIAAAALVAAPPGFLSLVSVTTPAQLAAHLLMVHTFVPGAFYSGNGVLWTLAIETHFYLAYPLFLALRRRFGSGRVCAALLLASAALTVAAPHVPPSLGFLYQSAPYRWWEWVLGCVVVEQVLGGARAPSRRPSCAAVIAAALGTLAVGLALPHVTGGGFLRTFLWPVLFGAVVVMAAWMRPLGTGLAARALLAVGHASYSLYLVHPIAYHLALAALVAVAAPAPLVAAGEVLAGALLTWGFYRAVERPFMERAARARAPASPLALG